MIRVVEVAPSELERTLLCDEKNKRFVEKALLANCGNQDEKRTVMGEDEREWTR